MKNTRQFHRPWSLLTIVAAAVALAGPVSVAASGLSPGQVERLELTLTSLAEGMGVFGATHVVRLADGTVAPFVTGTTGPNFASQAGRPLRPADQVRIGSQTKTYVATVILHQVDQGLLNLDDRVFDLVSDPGWALQDWHHDITIKHLLSMRSGLPDYLSVPDTVQSDQSTLSLWNSVNGQLHRSPHTLVGSTLGFAQTGTPGDPSAFFYSNTNYVLLGLVAETISCQAPTGCQSIEALIHDVVSDPLSLAGTVMPPDANPTFDHSDGTWLDRGVLWNGTVASFTRVDPSVPWAAGAMLSLPMDQLAWVVDLTTNQTGLLSAATFQERLRLTVHDAGTVAGTPAGYGLGIYRVTSPNTGATLLGHGGTISGFQTLMFQHGAGGHYSVLNFNTFVAQRMDPRTRPSDPMAALFTLERALLLPDPADRTPGTCVDQAGVTRCAGTFEATLAITAPTVIAPSGNAWPGAAPDAVAVPTVVIYGDQVVGIAANGRDVTVAERAAVEVVGAGASAITTMGGQVHIDGSVSANGLGARVVGPAEGEAAEDVQGSTTEITIASSGTVLGTVDVPARGVLVVQGVLNGAVNVAAGGEVRIGEGAVVYGPIRVFGAGVRISIDGVLAYGIQGNGFSPHIIRPMALVGGPALLSAPVALDSPAAESVAPLAPVTPLAPALNPWLPPGLVTPTGQAPF